MKTRITVTVGLLFGAALFVPLMSQTPVQRPPNFVLVFLDDSGYADTSVYGATDYRTPNIDRLAEEGNRFTTFYVPQSICSASRAALLTGSYPNRVSINGALPATSRTGINADEILLPEVLKTRGYATAIFGKWHLGAAPQFLPTRHGFDEYFGIPYSNDMRPAILVEGERALREMTQDDRDNETTWLTERAVQFIDRNRDRPFFLYVPHSMPHVPLAVSDKFRGKTSRLYSDVMLEIDWSVGQIAEALTRNGLDGNTLFMFASDNGPWLIYGDEAGSARPFRDGKHTTFEGGHREPFIARWPGRIPAGTVTDGMVVSFDLFPTLVTLAGGAVPSDRIIDGTNIWPWMSGERGAVDAHEALFFYGPLGGGLEGVRSGPWKLYVPHVARRAVPNPDGGRGTLEAFDMGLTLYDLTNDPGETIDVTAQHPDVVERLLQLVETARDDLGDPLTRRVGKNVRPAAQLPEGASPLPDGVAVPAARGRGGRGATTP